MREALSLGIAHPGAGKRAGDGPGGTGNLPLLCPSGNTVPPLPSIKQPRLIPQINLFPYQSCKQEAAPPP